MNFLSILISKSVELLNEHAPKAVQYYSKASCMDLVVVGAAAAIALYNLRSMVSNANPRHLNLPPKVPYSLPLFGHTLYVVFNANKFLDWCVAKYGDTFDLDLLGKTVTVAGGSIAEQVMKADAHKLSLEKGILTETLHVHYVFNEATFFLGFTANPAIIKLLLPQSKMPRYTTRILESVEYGLSQIIGEMPQTISNPVKFLQQVVAFISVRVLVGPEVEKNRDIIDTFAEFTNDITRNIPIWQILPKSLHKPLLPYLQSLNRHKTNMDVHLEPVVEKRRQMLRDGELETGSKCDYLQELIEFKYPDGKTFTNKEITDGVLLIAFASVHTTSQNCSFALYWLLARPDVFADLRQEIDRVLAAHNGQITDEGLKEMTFLDRFIRQVLRLGVDKLATGKKAMEDFTFNNGYQVPEGRFVQSLSRRIMYDSYTVDSALEELDPFTYTKREAAQTGRDNVAFGLGKHMCPGRFFAIHEIKLVLITLLKDYNIELCDKKPVEPVVYAMGMFALPNEAPIVISPRK
ncbi:hypothetical protein Unana1_03479 [Umbelopsis nana]